MEGELQRFIKVWITAISCLCYCYYIASRIPKGFLRLLSLFPILYIFLILPLNLSSIHLLGPTTFFLVWLATFKLLLFSFNQGPLSLSSSLNIFHFISIASLPIIPKHHPTSKDSKLTKNNTNPPHQLIRNIENSKNKNILPSHKKSSLLLFPKMLIAAMIICAYDYRENLHPHLILFFYCCHVYLGIELVLALCAAPARAMFGYEIEPQFNEPYLSTSLQDFWGRRWNLMVTNILRPTVYNPIRRISTYFVGHTFGNSTAMLATFLVSGLMHEVIYYYLARAPPTWEVTWFFVIHGVCTAAEVVAKKALLRRGWWLPRFVSVPFTLMFLVVTAQWLFFPQLLRNGVDRKAIAEYAIIVDLQLLRKRGDQDEDVEGETKSSKSRTMSFRFRSPRNSKALEEPKTLSCSFASTCKDNALLLLRRRGDQDEDVECETKSSKSRTMPFRFKSPLNSKALEEPKMFSCSFTTIGNEITLFILKTYLSWNFTDCC